MKEPVSGPAADTKRKLILIVDDDTDVRSALAKLLVNEGYSVIEAKDGRLGAALLESKWPDAIISDIKMPNMDGLELLKKTRTISQLPFLLMTGFSEVLETKDALALGATDFILKPFKQEELLASLSLALNQAPQPQAGQPVPTEEDLNQDLDYCRLSIDEFVSGKVSLADIFIRLSEQKYIQVARVNSELSIDRIRAYKSKGLDFLYIRKEDFARYIGMNLELTKAVTSKRAVTRAQRMRLMKHTSEILLQDAYVNGVQKDKLQASAALVEAMVSTLSEDKDLFELIELLQTHADYLYAHSVGVALYSAMIAKEVGWTSTPSLFRITMGGLLHDIGKKEINRAILEKPRQNLSSEERAILETHPLRGKELLSLIRSVPDDVSQIAMHHHENNTGRGFPYRLLKGKIHPLAKLIGVANEFCDLVLKSPSASEPMTAHVAIERLYSLKLQELEPSFLRALMNIFNYPIPIDMPKSTLPPL